MSDSPTVDPTSETGWHTSATTKEVMPALVEALGKLPAIPRDQTAKIPTKDGGSYTYTYADLASVLTLVKPVLADHGLAVVQAVSTPNPQSIVICTTIFHKSGEWIKFDPLSMSAGGTAQAIGSAITYARRYSLMACLGLAADDDDGAAASVPQPSRHQEQRTQAPEPIAPAEPRSEDERYIRQLIAGLPGAFINDVRKAFKAKFGLLGELDLDRHGEALTWTQEVVAEIEARSVGGGLNLTEIIAEVNDRVAADANATLEVLATGEQAPSEPEPLVSSSQVVALKALFRGQKTNASDQLSMVSELIKRPIVALTELTASECDELIKVL